jgi:integrase
MSKRPDPATGKRTRKERYGQGLRYRVCGIPGVKDESFAKLEDAKDWLAKAQVDAREGKYIDPRLGSITLAEYVEKIWWPNRNDPTNTRGPMWSRISNHILPYMGHIPINLIDVEHLRAWLAALRRSGRVNEATIAVIWTHLVTILGSAVGKRLPRNPCEDIGDERPTGNGEVKARAWEADEVRRIRAGLPDWYRVIADLGVGAGLRQGEAFGFSPDDVDEARMVIHLRRQLLWDPSKPYCKLPKGRKERDIPLSPRLLKHIREHEERHPPVELVLPWEGPGNGNRDAVRVRLLTTTRFRNPINPSTYNEKNLKPALVAAGLLDPRDEDAPGSGWVASREMMHHRFRHTYASVQLHAGEDVVSVSHWMGHASPEITFRTYAHFMPDAGMRGRSAVDEWLERGGS